MASLWKRKGVYYARYYVGGKQRSLSLGTASYQAAKEKLRQFESRLAQRGDDALPTKTPVAEALQAYVRHILVAKTKAGVKSDLYYLRDIFGPVCKELEVKQKDARARAHRAYLPAKYLEQIRTQDIVAFVTARVQHRAFRRKQPTNTAACSPGSSVGRCRSSACASQAMPIPRRRWNATGSRRARFAS